ncbi:hypothetical protein J27TS7_10730 [Paenibacillus dendritiformis]|nr:hypothetical protein J27TS7_10730 [Paenibacillus dendritiformis]
MVVYKLYVVGYDAPAIIAHKREESIEQIALPIYRVILPIPTHSFMVNDFIDVSVHPTDKFPTLARCNFFG